MTPFSLVVFFFFFFCSSLLLLPLWIIKLFFL